MSSMVIFILGSVIAERGIGAHYSGKRFVIELVGYAMPDGRSSRGKIVCIINANIALRGWWLLSNKVELTTAAVIANGIVFLTGYRVFRGANKQKHVFKKNPKAPIWGRPPKVIGGKLLASGYWGIARHCNYLGDLLVASSFSLPCGISSPVPYFYPVYLLILLIWRERRDEARCAEKYREVWAEYCKLVPWRILPYVY
ncbi:hypothetical protein TEA_006713 [Camellia sinensis var. sinensis]|uniref:Delta(14)-sterol reductase n=1 Tax=Camellia sinensis var. sinensis TaxID=542762 RepID=A0A4S4EIB2_CAMSN|nr:hypothetical protein TEA_006713 [Camellia sinensis var. sinensis]